MILTKPYKYQKQGAALLHLRKGRTLLADEMGLGKTLEILMWMDKVKPRLTIVVCPASLKWNWEKEIMIHTGRHADILEGRRAPKRQQFIHSDILIINYDILKNWLVWLRKLRPEAIIIDECHYIKNWESQRSTYVRKLCKGVRYVIPMSGTPLTNRPSELWPTLNLVWPEEFPKKDLLKYLKRYCNPRKTRFGMDFRGAARLPELHRRLKKNGMIRRRKVDVLKDLPEKRRSILTLELDPADRKEYDFAKNDLIKWVAANYGVGRARKARRAEAFLQVTYLKRLAAKLKFKQVILWLKEFMEETDDKIVVGVIHIAAVKSLHNHFPKSVIVNGSIKGRKRQEAVDQFQNDPDTRMFIGNIDAAGVGLTLTAASTGIFAEMAWTPGQNLQFEDRIHRIGQQRGVLWHYSVARNTIEERLCDMLQTKQRNVEAVLDGTKAAGDLDLFDELVKEIRKGKL